MMNASLALNLPYDLWLVVGGFLGWLVTEAADTFTLKALRDSVRPYGVTGRTKADLGQRLIESIGSSVGTVPVWPNVLSWGEAQRAAQLGVFGSRPGDEVILRFTHNTGTPDWMHRAKKHFGAEIQQLLEDDYLTNASVRVVRRENAGNGWTYHEWAEGEYSTGRYAEGVFLTGQNPNHLSDEAQHGTGLTSGLRFKCLAAGCTTKSGAPSFNPGRAEDDGEGPCVRCGGPTVEAYRYDISARNNRSGTFPRYLDALRPPYYEVSGYGRPVGFGHVIPQRTAGAAAKVAFTPIDERTGEKGTRTARHAKGHFTHRLFECMDPNGERFVLLGWAFVEDESRRGVFPLAGLNRAARAALNLVAHTGNSDMRTLGLTVWSGERRASDEDTAATL